jgi:hypothetical protein
MPFSLGEHGDDVSGWSWMGIEVNDSYMSRINYITMKIMMKLDSIALRQVARFIDADLVDLCPYEAFGLGASQSL